MSHGRTLLLAVALATALAWCATASPSPPPRLRVLVFTKTAGFRHESIPAARAAFRALGARYGFRVDSTEDATRFSDDALAGYNVVVFLLTTGDVLDETQQEAFTRWIRAGGGYVGVHSATDTEHDWPWYGGLVGARFRSHPAVQRAVVRGVDGRLPARWPRRDEWYNFAAAPRGAVVLATVDETSYEPGPDAMGADHPIAWRHAYGGGRAWYTGGGHTVESYAEPVFRAHLLGGIAYAAGLEPRIASVSASARGRRLIVAARYDGCLDCRATVSAGGRRPVALRRGRAAVGELPPGRVRYTVEVEDRATGLTATVTRSLRIG